MPAYIELVVVDENVFACGLSGLVGLAGLVVMAEFFIQILV